MSASQAKRRRKRVIDPNVDPRDPLSVSPLALAEIVRRLLRVGVPPTALANALDMEPGPMKVIARNLRRETYGTDELAEAHSFLTWLSYEKMLDLIMHGSPEVALKAAMQIQSKSMAITARQTPEEVSLARAEIAVLREGLEITEEDIEAEAAAYEEVRGHFVPSDDLDD